MAETCSTVRVPAPDESQLNFIDATSSFSGSSVEDGTITVTVTAENVITSGDGASVNGTFYASVEGSEQTESVSVSAGETVEVEFQFSPPSSGDLRVCGGIR